MKNVLILSLVVLCIGGLAAQYTKESHETAKVYSVVEQQEVSGNKDGFNTHYEYLVNTDKGTMRISPSGVYASSAFGTLKEGKEYEFFLRGYNIPFLGMYPNIITARER